MLVEYVLGGVVTAALLVYLDLRPAAAREVLGAVLERHP